MKQRLPFLFAALLLITGCEKIKDATTIKVDTSFDVDFPVTAAEVKTTQAGAFNVTESITLADNPDLESYLSKIDDITLSNLEITVNGLTEGQVINSVSLDAAGLGNVLTLTNISSANNTFHPEVSSTLLNQMGDKLRDEGSLTLTVSGSTSGAMTFVISCTMDAKVAIKTL
jgi:hypothetical protein